MKGKATYTSDYIKALEELIQSKMKTLPSGQKAILDKIRGLGFFGKDDWGITNLQLSDLRALITSGRITVNENNAKPTLPTSKAEIS